MEIENREKLNEEILGRLVIKLRGIGKHLDNMGRAVDGVIENTQDGTNDFFSTTRADGTSLINCLLNERAKLENLLEDLDDFLYCDVQKKYCTCENCSHCDISSSNPEYNDNENAECRITNKKLTLENEDEYTNCRNFVSWV